MKLYGSLSQLVAAIFRKDSNNITLRPNQSVTYNADRDVQLPEQNANSVLVSKDSPDVLTNKSISGTTNTLSDIPNAALAGSIDATKIGAGSVDNTEFGYLNGVTSSIQTQLGSKAASGANSDITSLSGLTTALSTGQGGTGVNSTATFPSSGVVVTEASSATLTNKTIDGDTNTIQDLGLSSLKTVLADANKAVLRDAAGAVTSALIADVNISAIAAISDSKLATISTAGKVANSATTATSAATASTIVSRDVAGSTSVNTLSATNIDVTGLATMDKAYIDGATGNGFIEFEGQTVGDVAAPTVGEARLFAGTDGKIYVRKAGSSQAEELGAGGSGEINLVDNSSDAGNWGVVNATATTNTTAANNPLSGTIDTSIAVASATSGGYARYRFSMPPALKQRKLKLEWYQIASSLASGAYRVEVWTNAASDYSGAYTELSLSTDSSGTSSIPNLNGKYNTTFDTNGSDYYEIRIVRTAASAATIYIANVVCGPGIQPQGAVAQYLGQLSFTPNNFGTVATTRYESWRVGNKLRVVARWTNGGTLGGSAASLSLPSGYTLDSTQFPTSTQSVGNYIAVRTTAGTLVTGAVFYDGSDTTKLYFAANSGAVSGALTKDTGVIVGYANGAMDITFEVPIAEWAGSGTVQLAQNDVEYAFNSDVTTTASVTGSGFGYGPNGVQFPAANWSLGTSYVRRVQFQSPIQVGDSLIVEIDFNNDGRWVNLFPRALQSTATYGVFVAPVAGQPTQAAVTFGSGGAVSNGATYGANGTASWSGLGASSTARWRVRKSSAGAAVGFGIVQPGTSAGLVSASGLPGNTTGNAIASGYVGEVITGSLSYASALNSSSSGPLTITSVLLTPGRWMVSGAVIFRPTSTTFAGGAYGSEVSVSTANVDTWPTNNTLTSYPTTSNPSAIFGGYSNALKPGVQGADLLQAYLPIPPIEVVITTNTTYRLTASTQVTAGAVYRWGHLIAHRIA